jgi:hypothetical protein
MMSLKMPGFIAKLAGKNKKFTDIEIGGAFRAKNISTEQQAQEQGTRIQKKDEDRRRQESFDEKKTEGKKGAFRLRTLLSALFSEAPVPVLWKRPSL